MLGIETFTRIGYKKTFLVKVEISFEDLASIMDVKLLSQNARLTEILPGAVKDIMYNVVLDVDPYKCHLIVGPITKAELAINYLAIDEKHFPSAESQVNRANSYPDVSIFIDVDVYQNGTLNTQDLKSFVENSGKIVEDLSQNVTAYLLGVKIN